MSKLLQKHEVFMRRALDLAKRGISQVEPNPMVGAVLVKNGKIIAEGFHQYFGGPHAEVNVLKKVTKSQIRGATLYVTLEPCCHFGKTPPCTNFLISIGVKHIVVAMRDPNKKVAGKGILQLKRSGIKVEVGVLEKEAQLMNQVFIKNILTGLPYVSIKLGVSMDGKITSTDSRSRYITNELSKKQVHVLRSKTDAILTTSETVLSDNSHLGVRLVKGKDPLRVVIDSKLRIGLDAAIFRDKNIIVATTVNAPKKKISIMERKGVRLLVYKNSKVPLKTLLKDLYRHGVSRLIVEAGASLVTSLLSERLADELILFIAPKILVHGISWIQDSLLKNPKKHFLLENIDVRHFGDDTMVKGNIVYSQL